MVTQENVEIRTPDGVADGILFRSGPRGFIHMPDAVGIRPAALDMARRLAGEGYTVLVPNTFYRSTKPPVFPSFPTSWADPDTIARFQAVTGALTPEAIARDAVAYVAFMKEYGPLGVVGHCFTGKLALRIAATCPNDVALAVSFHGGGLWVDNPANPALVLPAVKARLYFAHAANDRSMPQEAIDKLDAALKAWGGRYESEIYPAQHSWTIADSPVYDAAQSERAFQKLRALAAETLH